MEGDMIARKGAWIITGIEGEQYPCDAEIFQKTYEPADDEAREVWKTKVQWEMTKKELIENLTEIRECLPIIEGYFDKWVETLGLIISALRPWHRLSEEKPPEEGWYWTIEIAFIDAHKYGKSKWHTSSKPLGFTRNTVTHWAHIVPLEDEE
jgi:hypothetical protein